MKKRSSTLALLLILGMFLGSAEDGIVVKAQSGTADWPMAGGGPARTGEASGAGPVTNPAVIWRYTFPQGEMGYGGPPFTVVAGDTVFFPTNSWRGDIVALDAATAVQRWRAEIGYIGIEFDPGTDLAVADGTLYLTAADGPDASSDSGPPMAVVALDAATGAERWRFSYAFDLFEVALTPAEGALYLTAFANESDVVIALDGETGIERWRTPMDDGFGLSGPAAVVDGVVYVSTFRFGTADHGFVVGLDAATGAERVRAPFEGFPIEGPAVGGGTAYLQTTDADGAAGIKVFALEMATGSERWSTQFTLGDTSADLVVADGVVYVSDMTMAETVTWTIHALDAATGQERWTAPGGAAGAVAGGVLYSGLTDARIDGGGDALVAVDAATGQERWRLPVGTWRIAIAEGRLFASGPDGHTAVAEWTGDGTPVPVVIEEPGEGADGGETGGLSEVSPPEISVVNADGSNLTTLAPGEHPVWSPDGTKLAYEGTEPQETDIWIMNADGSGQVRVAPVPGWDHLPSWSPDGSKISFVNGNGDLYVVGADGSGLRKLTSVDGPMSGASWGDPFMERPSWSADGTRIAYASTEEGGPEIWVINADGTGKTRLTNAPSLGLAGGGDPFETVVTVVFCPEARPIDQASMDILPDADPAAYEAQGCRRAAAGETRVVLYSMPIAPKSQRAVARGETDASGAIVLRGSLVPDVEAYQLEQSIAAGAVYADLTVPFASSYVLVNYPVGPGEEDEVVYEEEQVFDEEGAEYEEEEGEYEDEEEIPDQPWEDQIGLEDPEMIATGPSWSPDGSKIACVVLVPDGEGGIGAGSIWVMNADGSGQRQVTDTIPLEFAPVWSPDGTRLLFASWYDDSEETDLTDLYVVNVDGTGLTKLTKNDSPDYDPVWSPDGSKIAFSSLTGQGFGLFTINSDGSGMAVLVDLPGEEYSSAWSPDGSKIAFVATSSVTGGGD